MLSAEWSAQSFESNFKSQKTNQQISFPFLIHFIDLWSEFMSYGFGAMAEENGVLKQNRKNGQNFQCAKCGKWYSTKNIMLRHMNHECGVEKNIQCKFCSKMFLRKWNLKQHIKRIHENTILGNTPLSLVSVKHDSPLKPRAITPGINPM